MLSLPCLLVMSLWNVSDYLRLRTGGDDPVLDELAQRRRLAGARVLDVGCGPGRAAAALSERYAAAVTGLDASPEMLAAAREIAPSVTFVEGVAEALPFDDLSFDVVVSSFVVHLLDRTAAFPEIRRVLREDGVYWIKTEDPATIRDYWAAPLFPFLVQIETARFPDEQLLRSELLASGFRHVQTERRRLQRIFSRDEALDKLRSGAYSTLRLLPDEELADGVRKAPKLLSDPVRYELVYLVVEATR